MSESSESEDELSGSDGVRNWGNHLVASRANVIDQCAEIPRLHVNFVLLVHYSTHSKCLAGKGLSASHSHIGYLYTLSSAVLYNRTLFHLMQICPEL